MDPDIFKLDGIDVVDKYGFLKLTQSTSGKHIPEYKAQKPRNPTQMINVEILHLLMYRPCKIVSSEGIHPD